MVDIYVQIKDFKGNFLYPETVTKKVKTATGETLENIEANAQENRIEKIKVNGKEQEISNKTVNLDLPDISNLAAKSEIPTMISALTNDAGYLTSVPEEYVTETELVLKGYITEHQDISGKADITDVYTKTEIDTKLGEIETLLEGV